MTRRLLIALHCIAMAVMSPALLLAAMVVGIGLGVLIFAEMMIDLWSRRPKRFVAHERLGLFERKVDAKTDALILSLEHQGRVMLEKRSK
jgi:hypothetical protein